MSSPSTLHFPDAVTMTQYLSNHELLKSDYFKEKGITKAIAELAAERFANSDKVEMGVKMGTMILILDLQTEEDGFTGKPLPNFGKFDDFHASFLKIFSAMYQLHGEKILRKLA